ncbi:MAG: hypothetical protein BV457_08565, partial [Thermoplasmata archaeon M9B1D]
VVLAKVFSKGIKDNKNVELDYTMIDFYDDKNYITAMMRTTGFPVSIIAQMIENDTISGCGVFGGEEIVPTKLFFQELKKRNIVINKELREI